MDIATIVLIAGELVTLCGIVVPAIVWVRRIIDGQRCQLRQAMLSIYYKHYEEETIRQYEAEHFDKCYHAYKALGGNSFIDEIYKTAHTWKVIS